MKQLHLVWIGSIVPEEQYKKLCCLGYKNQQASRLAQLNIIKGLEKHYETSFDYISGPALPGYPKFRYLFIKSFRWQDNNGATCGECAGYLNVEYINRLFKAKALIHATDRIISRYPKNDKVIVFANSPHTPFMKAALRVKSKHLNSKLVLVIPDLPQYMESDINPFKKALKFFDIRIINKLIPKFDYYILYSAKMREFLGIPPEKCVTMEGCASMDNEFIEKKESPLFTFMYSGKTDVKFGINLLLNAFSKIKDENCQLIITGAGDAVDSIIEATKHDHRIHYYGFIDDYSQVKQMQRNADIMLNMRLPSEIASNYCFPSKLFEYMKSGNPVISFRIGGIEKEYFNYLLPVEEENAESLAQTMKHAMQMSSEERKTIGMNALSFIREKKNYLVQTEIIYKLIEKS